MPYRRQAICCAFGVLMLHFPSIDCMKSWHETLIETSVQKLKPPWDMDVKIIRSSPHVNQGIETIQCK